MILCPRFHRPDFKRCTASSCGRPSYRAHRAWNREVTEKRREEKRREEERRGEERRGEERRGEERREERRGEERREERRGETCFSKILITS